MAKSVENVPTFMAKISLSVLDKKRPILKPPLRIECSQSILSTPAEISTT
jgi:hypothetical protein